MVEKGMSCVKYLLFAFNLIFFLFGALLIGVGAYVQIELASYSNFAGDHSINGAAILVIIVGVVTLIVGFFGCCGAIKENHCMIMTFAALIGIILICELGAGIAGYVLQGQVRTIFADAMKSSMNGYVNNTDGVQKSWDNLQKELHCCGINNASDWSNTGLPKGTLPQSCCDPVAPCTMASPTVYKKGCLDQLEDGVKSNVGIVAGAGIGIAVVELVGIILACCLAKAVRNEYEVA